MRAVIYARYSSDNQRDASIDDQVRQCRKRIDSDGWRLTEVYSDHAISGASTLRPGYQKMLEDARNGGFDVLIAEAMDRLPRDQEDIAGLYKQLSFADVRVPASNVLGQVDEAFGYLGHNLPQERLTVAVGSVAQARSAIAAAIDYTQNRKVFGASVSSFQNTKFELAACSTEVEAAQAMLDRAVALHVEGELSGPDAARVKLFCTEMQQRVVDRCLQLFGGYGYMMEYPIARLYTDARVARIYAGTSEVMKVIIAKSLGL